MPNFKRLDRHKQHNATTRRHSLTPPKTLLFACLAFASRPVTRVGSGNRSATLREWQRAAECNHALSFSRSWLNPAQQSRAHNLTLTCSYTLERQPPESEERVSPGQGRRCDVADGRLANAAYADRAVLLIRWPEPPRLHEFNSSSACGVAQRTSAGPRGVDLHCHCCGANRSPVAFRAQNNGSPVWTPPRSFFGSAAPKMTWGPNRSGPRRVGPQRA